MRSPTALISPRRMGKTGLIQHCFASPRLNNRFYTFLFDIYATKSFYDFSILTEMQSQLLI